MIYHIKASKKTTKKQYELDFMFEGDLMMIEDHFTTLGIDITERTTEKAIDEIYTIKTTIYNPKTASDYIINIRHTNIAQTCLILVFL